MTLWNSPWCWGRLRAEGEESVKEWDGCMASPMQRTWTWANFRRWWGTGKPSMLQSMGSQRVKPTEWLNNDSMKRASLVAQLVKKLPAMQETWVWSLGWKDPLEKGMASYSSILAWRIPWTDESDGLQSMESQRVYTLFISEPGSHLYSDICFYLLVI